MKRHPSLLFSVLFLSSLLNAGIGSSNPTQLTIKIVGEIFKQETSADGATRYILLASCSRMCSRQQWLELENDPNPGNQNYQISLATPDITDYFKGKITDLRYKTTIGSTVANEEINSLAFGDSTRMKAGDFLTVISVFAQ